MDSIIQPAGPGGNLGGVGLVGGEVGDRVDGLGAPFFRAESATLTVDDFVGFRADLTQGRGQRVVVAHRAEHEHLRSVGAYCTAQAFAVDGDRTSADGLMAWTDASGGAVGAALFTLAGAVRVHRRKGCGGESGQVGEAGRGQRRGIDPGKRVTQGAFTRSAVAPGEGIVRAAEPGQNLLLTPPCPFRDGDKGVVPGTGHRADADGEQGGQLETSPPTGAWVGHAGQGIQEPGRHDRRRVDGRGRRDGRSSGERR
ncbi:hypothetical protein OIE64_26685 [Streptomyces brevispora]|uniref:Uncharacterized protein n=1 Tax=Streptomyces brevispora TaxID=887462 RepID=A0ABZ1G833_9ACTN|nr:hypothetical protein [Streptomyces brevispora]WSC16059.1 hypothetical protein OIE64_26685 [Streptomyces brevispora]